MTTLTPTPTSSPLTTSYILRASHLLSTTIPSLSASILSSSPIARSTPGTSTICKSCSTILMPGWNAYVRTQPRGKPGVGTGEATKNTVVVWGCTTCGFEDRIEVVKPRIKRRRKGGRIGAEAGPVVGEAVTVTEAKKAGRGGNLGSKARAKKRRGGSLADALAKERRAAGGGGTGTGGFGLNLMDLMKMG